MSFNCTVICLYSILLYHIFADTNINEAVCNENSNVICIGLETYGQSLCRQAIANNLTILDVFEIHSSTSTSLTELFDIEHKCYQDIQISNIDQLTTFITEKYNTKSTPLTALIGVSSSLDSLDIILPIIKQCLSNSIHVITIMTSQLSYINSMDKKYLLILKELHEISIQNNVLFKSTGLSSFLSSIFPFDIMQNKSIQYEDIIGRITCNADYIAYIHRNSKPNIWYDWYIGERIDDYHNNAATLKFYKLLQNELNVFTHLLLSKQQNINININDWMYTFNSKAIYDQHGETVSFFLNRQIETGRVIVVRFNGRLMNVDNDNSIHIVFKIGLFKNTQQRQLLTPCFIEWVFLDKNDKQIKDINIKNIDIIAAMMNDAIQNVMYIHQYQRTINCGVCCNQNQQIQEICLQQMTNVNIKSEL